MQLRPNKRGLSMLNAGERLVSRRTSMLRSPCLLCHCERAKTKIQYPGLQGSAGWTIDGASPQSGISEKLYPLRRRRERLIRSQKGEVKSTPKIERENH